MVELDQFKSLMNAYEEPLAEMRIHFDVAGKEKQMEELERKVEEPGFWDNPEESQQIMKDLKNLKELIDEIRKLYQGYEDTILLIDMAYEEEDPSMVREIEKIFGNLKNGLKFSGFRHCSAENMTAAMRS